MSWWSRRRNQEPLTRTKRVDEVERYFFVWEDVLSPRENILTSSWQSDSGITIDSHAIMVAEYLIEHMSGAHSYSVPGQSTLVVVAGGADKKTYGITNTITTDRGRTLARTRHICVVDMRDGPAYGGTYTNRQQYF